MKNEAQSKIPGQNYSLTPLIGGMILQTVQVATGVGMADRLVSGDFVLGAEEQLNEYLLRSS